MEKQIGEVKGMAKELNCSDFTKSADAEEAESHSSARHTAFWNLIAFKPGLCDAFI